MLTNIVVPKNELIPYLESSINAKIYLNEKDSSISELVKSINVKNSYSGFFNRILNYYVTALSTNETHVSSSFIRYSTDKKVLDKILFTKNRHNIELFQIFEKIGLSIVTIDAAYDETNKTLYLTNYLLRKIKSLDITMQTQISMYLISLITFYSRFAKSIETTYNNIPVITQVDMGANDEFITNKEDLDTFYSFIKIFDDDFICNLAELDVNNVDTAKTWSHSIVVPVRTPTSNYSGSNQYALLKQDENLYLVFKRSTALWFMLDFKESKIYANAPYLLLDYLPDSFINQISQILLNKNYILYSKKFDEFINELKIPMKLANLEDHEEAQNLVEDLATKINIEPMTNIDDLKNVFKDQLILDTSTSYNVSMREDYNDDAYALQLLENTSDSIKAIDLPKDLQIKLTAYAKGIIYSSFFAGDSGTGKTTLAKVIGHKLGLPTLSINFSSNIEESDVIGTWISNVNKTSSTDPEFVWKDGLLTKAIRNGYLIILEEINFARPGILGKLNSLLDESRQIDLPTGDIVKAHKNFRMIVTGNIGYEGTNLLNLAFVNRYDYIREFSQMTIDEIENIIKTKTGYKDNAKISSILQVYLAIKKYSTENKLNLVISVRQLINLFKQAKFHATAYDAVINTMVNTAFLQEQEHREHFIASVLPAFTLKFKL